MSTNSKIPISLQEHLVYICSRLLAYGLPVLYFLIVISFYLKTYDSAQIKITFTQIGTLFLMVVWFTKIFLEGRSPFSRQDLIYVLPIICFLASGIISFLHSPFKGWAFEETSRRVFYMFLALITIAELNTTERMERLRRWLLAAAWVCIGYGFIQYLDSRLFVGSQFGLDPFIWRGAFGHRVFSTFGNPNFYGNFLVILTPIIFAAILRNKGSLVRPFLLIPVILVLVVITDKITKGFFGGIDPSFQFVYLFFVALFLVVFVFLCVWGQTKESGLSGVLILFSLLFLNLYATETKGAWMGFMAATGATLFLVVEYFLHLDQRFIDPKKYISIIGLLTFLFALLIGFISWAFFIPFLQGNVKQIGFQILWIPGLIGSVFSIVTLLWTIRKPWNLKKIIYGFLAFFMVAMGTGVLQFAKTRLVSVSFRMFTWISTWEMVRTSPILGNGVGTFKIIYPAYRRPEIIVLEGKSNTETDHSEDEYLEVWQDEGLIGFGIFIWFFLTALIFGLKQLRWYSEHHHLDPTKRKKLLDIESDPRSYEVLGYLGAYVGALIHWTVDVSVRFVSSGVFSGLLPGVLVAYARNHSKPVLNEARLEYDRWIRAFLVFIWFVIFLYLKLELVPQSMIRDGDTTFAQIVFWIVLASLLLFGLIEFLERGNYPSEVIPFQQQYRPPQQKGLIVRWILIVAVILSGVFGMNHFGNHFFGDVYHNLAIFFSKEGVWTKSPLYDSKLFSYPPDIREKYQKVGGALEHYAAVNKANTAFPMAHYFTGNVFNDWGSQIDAESMNARNKGDMEEAQRLRERSIENWNKSENAYNNTKKLAPNYVQTHHQLGMLNIKRAEQAARWGELVAAKKYYEEAEKDFRKYRMLDPVFPPNYDRLVQLLLMQGKIDEVIELYKQAIHYNDVIGKTINKVGFPDRVGAFYVSLAKVYLNRVLQTTNDPYSPPKPDVMEALNCFKLATEADPNNPEAWKGYGFLLEKLKRKEESQAAFLKAVSLAPNDPDLKVQSTPSLK